MTFLYGYIRTQLSTTLHRFWVLFYLSRFCARLIWRGLRHDLSKYRYDEAEHFARSIFKLKNTTYGTDEYRALLREIKPAIDLHYARNSHHPEHWPNGYADMLVIDRIEMVADWAAAVRRHADGDLNLSLPKNAERFGYDERDEKFLRGIAEMMRVI